MTRADEDKLILTDGRNCEKFKKIEAAISKGKEWNTLFNEKLPKEYLNCKVYDWLKEETGYADYDLM